MLPVIAVSIIIVTGSGHSYGHRVGDAASDVCQWSCAAGSSSDVAVLGECHGPLIWRVVDDGSVT